MWEAEGHFGLEYKPRPRWTEMGWWRGVGWVAGAPGHVWGHPVERSERWQVAGLDPRGIQRQDETFQFEQLNLAKGQRA